MVLGMLGRLEVFLQRLVAYLPKGAKPFGFDLPFSNQISQIVGMIAADLCRFGDGQPFVCHS